MKTPAAAQDVLDYWFGGSANGDAEALQAAFSRWFTGGASVDEEIRQRFNARIESALAGELREWEEKIPSRLALILLLDQFPRNIFRRTARAFAGDGHALRLAGEAVLDGQDKMLRPIERVFLLMPYQHAEDIGVQKEGVRLFEQLAEASNDTSVQPLLRSSAEYARKHRDIIAQFGRFPYRNEVLGRRSTDDELRWLQETDQRFGQ